MVFYGNGFRFVEAYEDDDEWELGNEPSTSKGAGIFDFIGELEEEAFFKWRIEQTDRGSAKEKEPASPALESWLM